MPAADSIRQDAGFMKRNCCRVGGGRRQTLTLTTKGQPDRAYTSITRARADGNTARVWGGMHYREYRRDQRPPWARQSPSTQMKTR